MPTPDIVTSTVGSLVGPTVFALTDALDYQSTTIVVTYYASPSSLNYSSPTGAFYIRP